MTRQARPIPTHELHRIMRETGAPHPDAADYGVSPALAIIGWGFGAIAAVLVAALVLL